MDNQRAHEIISALADGHNPYTGEVFSHDSVFQNPETTRALFAAADALSAKIRTAERKKGLPKNAGNPWGQDETNQLVQEFDQGINIIEIAKTHERTVGSIRSKLVQLGKIQY